MCEEKESKNRGVRWRRLGWRGPRKPEIERRMEDDGKAAVDTEGSAGKVDSGSLNDSSNRESATSAWQEYPSGAVRKRGPGRPKKGATGNKCVGGIDKFVTRGKNEDRMIVDNAGMVSFGAGGKVLHSPPNVSKGKDKRQSPMQRKAEEEYYGTTDEDEPATVAYRDEECGLAHSVGNCQVSQPEVVENIENEGNAGVINTQLYEVRKNQQGGAGQEINRKGMGLLTAKEIEKLLENMELRLKDWWTGELSKWKDNSNRAAELKNRCENLESMIADMSEETEQIQRRRQQEMQQWEREKQNYEEQIIQLRSKIEEHERGRLEEGGKNRMCVSPDLEDENNNDSWSVVAPRRQKGDRERRPSSEGRKRRSYSEATRSGRQKEERRSGGNANHRNGDRRLSGDHHWREKRNRLYVQESWKPVHLPTPMGAEEMEYELAERRRRKRNIVVQGVRATGRRVEEEIKKVVRENLEVEPNIQRIQRAPGGPIVTLGSMDIKKAVMTRKGGLRGLDIWIDDDLTTREKEVQDWLREEACRKREEGRAVRIGYQKIRIDGTWWIWNDRQGFLENRPFRW